LTPLAKEKQLTANLRC